MATITAQQLFRATQVGSSATVLYTVPANTAVMVKKLTFTNPTGTARTLSVYLLNQNQSADATGVLVSARTMAAGEVYECTPAQGLVVPANGTIQALCDQTNAVVAQGSGLLIS